MTRCPTLLPGPGNATCGKPARLHGYRNPHWPWQRAWWVWRARVQKLAADGYRSLHCRKHA